MIDTTDHVGLERQWREKFPSTLSGLFAFYQCLCTITIIGCELGSVLIDLFNATIYVGFWASLFFMTAWISQAVSVSCRQTRKCATYTLVIQCIALFFTVCVIGFDAYFLIQPTACFFSLTLCNSTIPIRGVFYSEQNFNDIKIPLIKGQLATATVMFAFCIDYMIIYIVTRIQIRKIKSSNEGLPTSANGAVNTVSTNPVDRRSLPTNKNAINNTSLPTTDRKISASSNVTVIPLSVKQPRHSVWSIESIDICPIEV